MIGWGNCARAAPKQGDKELTLISEEDEHNNGSAQKSPQRQGIMTQANGYRQPLPKLKLIAPPQNLSIMPRTRRQ